MVGWWWSAQKYVSARLRRNLKQSGKQRHENAESSSRLFRRDRISRREFLQRTKTSSGSNQIVARRGHVSEIRPSSARGRFEKDFLVRSRFVFDFVSVSILFSLLEP